MYKGYKKKKLERFSHKVKAKGCAAGIIPLLKKKKNKKK